MIVIAEFCQNHNGDFEILKKMVDAAAEGGATHGKVQTIFADDLSYREPFEAGRKSTEGTVEVIQRPYQPEYDRLKGLELDYEQHRQFMECCQNAGLIPMTTAFNATSVPHLKELGFKSIKVASYDCGSLPLIQCLSRSFDEIVISTGATFDDEIERTAQFLKSEDKNFTFLHCVTVYPTPLEKMNLKRMDYLRQWTPAVGLSEHSDAEKDGVKACLAAIYLGATAIERHFTILDRSQTKDGKVSIDQQQLKEIIDFAKLDKEEQKSYLSKHVPEMESMLGVEKRELSAEERLNRDYYRGRFCNKVDGKQIYNWEEEVLSLF